jgi:GDPmannose 4,6-dehydratase
MPRRALITGVGGQDGSYLAELLLDKGYEVHGAVRHVALEAPDHRLWRLRDIQDKIHLHPASVDSYSAMFKVLKDVSPNEVYHLAAVSYISYAFEEEFSAIVTNIMGTYNVLSALRDLLPECRLYYAGSSEMFGKVQEVPQNENTPFRPHSAYGISKVAGFHLADNFRDNYGMHISSGIMFNHESPRRGHEFVTRKISRAVARIRLGKQEGLELGNLEALRDWGYAKDYVQAAWLMLQQDVPQDYVIATGKTHSVREFVEAAFRYVGLNWEDHVKVSANLLRPFDNYTMRGDYSKAERLLGWRPTTSFEDLVQIMVEHDLMVEKNTPR